jgi:6-phosphofructokinase 2
VMQIATLTMNPTIDVSLEVDRVLHTHKMRGRNERHDPGGGGINVVRPAPRSTDFSISINSCGPASGSPVRPG